MKFKNPFPLLPPQSLKSCVSEGIQAIDERVAKQEDIRSKKV